MCVSSGAAEQAGLIGATDAVGLNIALDAQTPVVATIAALSRERDFAHGLFRRLPSLNMLNGYVCVRRARRTDRLTHARKPKRNISA